MTLSETERSVVSIFFLVFQYSAFQQGYKIMLATESFQECYRSPKVLPAWADNAQDEVHAFLRAYP
jgi:hypothetical protein